MFCQECGKLLTNQSGVLVCKSCGWVKPTGLDSAMTKTDKRIDKEIVIVEDTEKLRTLPTITVKCPACKHNEAFWWLRQLRSADESEVRFFRCTKCEHTWREYD